MVMHRLQADLLCQDKDVADKEVLPVEEVVKG
jgi:hypothetical protein